MTRSAVTMFAVCAVVAFADVGCSKDKGVDTSATRVVPRADAAAAAETAGSAAIEDDDCEMGETCTGATSCQATCGLHELGDLACMCTAGALACTGCTLSAEFRPQIKDAVTLCDQTVGEGRVCPVKGETCIDVNYDNMGTARRDGCLCWQGRTRLEWECARTINGFFQDMGPPSPPAPVRDGGARGDGPFFPPISPPVSQPDAADAAVD